MPENIMEAPKDGVTVRMYRAGFGDCFLLAFRGQDGAPVYMLIDCGVHSQYDGGARSIRDVAKHVRTSTGGHLHVVAITHEHADHISGFYTARDEFKEMEIDQAWFAWTEKPGDPAAAALKKRHALMMSALQAAKQSLASDDSQAAGGIEGLLGFFAVNSGDILNIIRDKAKEEPRYFKPKCAPLMLPGVEGIRVFVLGPPEDRQALMWADPTGKPGEVYEEEAFAAALLANAGSQSPWTEESQPFARNSRVPFEIVKEQKELHSFFHEHYGFDKADIESWRRIDSDWQYSAEALALKLDSATNNTSLVLAIELQKSGRVLLFAGDAQVGNWESWHEGGWSEENGLAKGETITAKNLLNRTVLYKVGHHGSHNATLREKGLEMMMSEELTAMIPVDQEWAERRKPYPWKMPFDPLYRDLLMRTRGRVLRTDLGFAEPQDTNAGWRGLRSQPRVEELYIELTVSDH
jgi:hypothetical protein